MRKVNKHDNETGQLETQEVALPEAAKNKRKRAKATHGKGRKTKTIKKIEKPFPKTPGDVRSNSEAVAESWKDKRVREARSARHGVKVAGVEYKSVPAAFTELRLPMSRMIKVRLEVKREGKATFEHEGKKFNFILVEPKEKE